MKTKTIALMIGVLLVVGGMVYAFEGRRGLPEHEIFRIEYRPGSMYVGYMFQLAEGVEVSLEGHENIGELFPPLNMFSADSLKDIRAFISPELILLIEPNYITINHNPSSSIPNTAHGFRFGILESEIGRSFSIEPERSVTRAEFINMLGRLHKYGNEIIGVPNDSADCERYFKWAVEIGIFEEEYGNLEPDAILTREQAVVIMYRYIESFELNEYFLRASSRVTLVDFRDQNEISDWALQPVERLRFAFLLPSDVFEYFRPQDDTSHSMALEMLVRIGLRVHGFIPN